MLVSVSGSQGTGKTTLLNSLEKQGFNVLKNKTARSILKDWNLTLNDVNSSLTLKKKFQEELLYRKFQEEEKAMASQDLYFTERTFSDLFVYTLIFFGHFNEYDSWLNQYYEQCKKYNQEYKCVFFLKKPSFKIENDGVRSINEHYSKMVDKIMLDFTKEMLYDKVLYVIGEDDDNVRRTIIMNHLHTLSIF